MLISERICGCVVLVGTYLHGELEAGVHGVGGPEPADHGHHPHAPHAV